jgi:predicted RNase H-like HicB family nuclease
MKTYAVIEKVNDVTYTVFIPKIENFIIGSGKSVEEAIADFENSIKEVKEVYANHNEKLPKALQKVNFEYKYAIGSFFNHFDWINVSKFANRIKVNASLMRRYSYRNKEYISHNQIEKIENALHELGREISQIKLARVKYKK